MNQSTNLRHLHLLAEILLQEASTRSRPVRLEWSNIPTASIGPDPKNPKALLLKLRKPAAAATEDEASMFSGLVVHEIVCHGLHTDFDALPSKPVEARLTNLLEDIRGEKAGLKPYPGSGAMIHNALKALVRLGVFCGPGDEELHPAAALSAWLLTSLRTSVLSHTCLAEFAPQYRALVEKDLGLELVETVESLAFEAVDAGSTVEVVEIVRKIINLLQIEVELNPPKPPPPQKSDPDKAMLPPTEQGGSPEQGKPTRKGAQEILDAEEADWGAYGRGLEDILTEANGATRSTTGSNSGERHKLGEVEIAKWIKPIESRAASLRSRSRTVTAALELNLEALLEARTQATRHSGYSGKVVGHRAWRVLTGDTRVFQRKTIEEKIDTAAFLLLDESGSMNRKLGSAESEKANMTRMEAATRVCVGASEALHRVGIPFELGGFNETARMWKEMEQDWRKAIRTFDPMPDGGTATHLAVVWAASRLIASREARKVLVVITDGDPGDAQELAAAVNEIRRVGIEVRLVLIDSRHAPAYAGMAVPFGVATSPQTLAAATFEALKITAQ